ncbi:thiol:disulfide interchange protein [Escherichia coli]|uniref:Thiol:disulfide interchange protein n=1 Tax=Escherichia coli TaxID=562 RepID=A0A377AR59_ECOLX|nr:thiol:disulfide interchange protein [Escherichia coli]
MPVSVIRQKPNRSVKRSGSQQRSVTACGLFRSKSSTPRNCPFPRSGVVDRYWYRLYAMRAANVPTDFWHRAGGKQRLSTARALLLTFIYVQGMALTYTALGLVVAAAGLQFQAALQHPYVLIGLAIVFTLLAMSMFGLFTLQLPSSLQTRLTLMSNRQQGGSPGGVFVMGAIAGLICSPCTTAPLSAILLYIAQSGNMWLGGGTLYLYALGMGLPLMLITVFGNRLLPKSGPWMEQVKTAFGFVILALPVFLLERVIGDVWGLRLWSALGVAFFGWAFITSLQAKRGWMRVVQIILLAAALVSVRPLQDWAFGATHTRKLRRISTLHKSKR